jgi:hypothetical protein
MISKHAQKPVGLYRGEPMSPDGKKFERVFQGIPVHVDRPRGFVMKGETDGKPWSRRYQYDYGYIPRTKGGDGDQLDVFIGPKQTATDAYWAVQVKPDGSFDEYKVFLGFPDRDAAQAAYRAHIPKKLLKGMVTMRVEMMKAMLGIDSNGLKKSASVAQLAFLDELDKIAKARKPPSLEDLPEPLQATVEAARVGFTRKGLQEKLTQAAQELKEKAHARLG